MAIKYKRTSDGAIVADDKGNPVVTDDEKGEGFDFGIDAIHLYSKIPALQEEAKNHRLRAKEASEKLEAFGDIDPSKAREALQITANLSTGDLTKKEEVERIKHETEEAWRIKFEENKNSFSQTVKTLQEKHDMLEKDIQSSLLSNQFATSPHFSGKEPTTTLIPDIAEAYFGKYFKVEQDDSGKRRAVAYLEGNKIYSKSRPGDAADFDEAMSAIIENYPMKDAILQQSTGSGARGSGGTFRGGVIDRKDTSAFNSNIDKIARGELTVR